jgi:hypothetical protein
MKEISARKNEVFMIFLRFFNWPYPALLTLLEGEQAAPALPPFTQGAVQ